MENLSKVSKEYISLMRGCEVWSLNYEGCVYISGNGNLHMDGGIVGTLDSDNKVKNLWREYVNQEGL